MRSLRLGFSGFWEGFQAERWPIARVLGEAFELEIARGADLLACGPFGRRHVWHRGTKVFWTYEAWPYRTGESDFTVSHHFRADPRHLRFPMLAEMRVSDARKGRDWVRPAFEEWRRRPRFCNFIYSNPKSPTRNEFFRVLSRRREVTAPGVVHNNAPPLPGGRYTERWRMKKIAYQQQFRFTIAFESVPGEGYTTEKLFDALSAGTIPIYWGNPRIGEDVRKETFIDAADFESLEELADHVIAVDGDDSLAARHLELPDPYVKPIEGWVDELVGFFGRVLDFMEDPPRTRQWARAARLVPGEGARQARRLAGRAKRRLRDDRRGAGHSLP